VITNDDGDNNNNNNNGGGGGRSVSLEIFAIIIVFMNSVKFLWHLVSYFDNRTQKKFQVIVELKKVGNGRIHMIRNAVIRTVGLFILRWLWWGRCLT
jgi:uncharacterized spore protein YtfJ